MTNYKENVNFFSHFSLRGEHFYTYSICPQFFFTQHPWLITIFLSIHATLNMLWHYDEKLWKQTCVFFSLELHALMTPARWDQECSLIKNIQFCISCCILKDTNFEWLLIEANRVMLISQPWTLRYNWNKQQPEIIEQFSLFQ